MPDLPISSAAMLPSAAVQPQAASGSGSASAPSRAPTDPAAKPADRFQDVMERELGQASRDGGVQESGKSEAATSSAEADASMADPAALAAAAQAALGMILNLVPGVPTGPALSSASSASAAPAAQELVGKLAAQTRDVAPLAGATAVDQAAKAEGEAQTEPKGVRAQGAGGPFGLGAPGRTDNLPPGQAFKLGELDRPGERAAALEPWAGRANPADIEVPRGFVVATGQPSVPSSADIGSAPASPGPTGALEPKVGTPDWQRGLGQHVSWMAGQQVQTAELHLNPPDLGPLKITLTMDQDQASAQFVSTHAQVREAIESSMPQLREMLAQSGITLGQVHVGAQGFAEQTRQDGGATGGNGGRRNEPEVRAGEPVPLALSRGLVDTYA